MTSSRRLLVYILHDESAESIRGINGLVKSLRSDPWALEVVWLSFISLAGEARQSAPLSALECIQDEVGAGNCVGPLDVGGGLSIFDTDANSNLRKNTANSKGDWAPFLVLLLGTDPGCGLGAALDTIKARRCGSRLAFVAEAVTPLSRASLTEAGFELIDIADGMTMPKSDSDSALSWDVVLAKAVSVFPYKFQDVPPWVARDSQQTSNILPNKDATVGPDCVAAGTPSPTVVSEVTRSNVAEMRLGNLFTADLGNLSTAGRLTRSGLFVYLVLNVVLMLISILISFLSVSLSFGVLAIGFWIFLIGMIKRAHDVGLSGWFILVPFLNVWLLIAPGQPADNVYGRNPRAEHGGRTRGQAVTH